MTDQLISTKEAMDLSGLSRHTITSACKNGVIEGARKLGTSWAIPRSQFLDWMKTGRPKMGRPRLDESSRKPGRPRKP